MRVIDLIRHNRWPLSLAIAVGLVFSSVCLLNVARARVNPNFEYLPMKMVPGEPGDDFAHYFVVSSSQLSGGAAFTVDQDTLAGRTLVARLGEFWVYRV